MHTIIAGSKTAQFDGKSGPSDTGFHGGTILQSSHRYRAAARKGTWIVSRAFLRSEYGDKREYMTGFVVHHVSVSGLELLKRYVVVVLTFDTNLYAARRRWVSQMDSDMRIRTSFM